MNTVYFDSTLTDDERRRQLFQGQLFAFQPRASVLALVAFARGLIEEAFGALDPSTAQHHLSAEKFEAVLATFKPAFINHARSKQLVQKVLLDFGCDPEKTYFDVPRLRVATSNEFLTRGLAYRFEMHRDTWFSAPLNQLNWWFPIYAHESGNALAFHPTYWRSGVANGSEHYHLHEWYAEGERLKAAGAPDLRQRPEAYHALPTDPQIRLVLPPGGVTLFSAAHMHSTVPNETGKTRYSIDFRTVHLDDVLARRGAPNVDSQSQGTNLIDYYRVADLGRLPQRVLDLYESGTPLVAPLAAPSMAPVAVPQQDG